MEDVPQMRVPVYFFNGRNDYTTPLQVTRRYFERLEAPKGKHLVVFDQSALVAPIALTLSMFGAFKGLVALLGDPLGYLAAFLVYWIGWCLLLPALVLGGPRQVLALFDAGKVEFTRLGWKTHALLWGPIIFPLVFMFIPHLGQMNLPILVVSILLGLVIAATEEILWRGSTSGCSQTM